MNTPRLRFKDLGEINYPEWEWKKIEDCCLLIKDGTHGTHKDVIAGIPLLSAKDIYENSVHIPFDARKISEHDYKKIYSKYELKKEDVLITIVGTLGRTAIIDSNTPRIAFQRSVAVMRPSTQLITAKYLNYVCNSHNFQNEIEIRKKKGAQPGIYLGELSSISIPVPSLPEQQKIADFLSTYDEKIRLQRERVETLERRKKGLLQKIFSQEIRFNADDGIEFPAWTLKALGDIFSFKNGLNASRDSFENGNIPCIGVYDICRCAPITENAIRGYVSVDSNIKESFRVNFGDVLFQRSSETLQDVGHACVYIGKESVVYNGFVIKGTPKKQRQYIPEFIHWMLQSDFVRRQAIAFGAGAQHYNIGQESISSIIGYFPCVAEQKKIAKLFTAVDDQMNIEKERLSTMETIKKGLLQGLFC